MTKAEILKELEIEKYKLAGSLLYFTRIYYYLRTGRKFDLSHPIGRESHYITICRALTRVIDGKCKRLIINVPPRYGKTELLIHFVAWAMGMWPDSNFLYVSYSHTVAKKQTQTIRQILTMPDFINVFGVRLKDDVTAKDNFETTHGGSVYAAGSGGSITSRGAGIKGCDRFGGAIVIDDIHKPDEVSSDTIREGVIDWFSNTMMSRTNSPDTPIIFIGQCLHEADMAAYLKGNPEWEQVVIPALDEAGNALHQEMHSVTQLLQMQEQSPYVFAAQYQQNPQPAGGGIFKPEWFIKHEEEPKIIATFITADTAETDKNYNDATVFSFWGLYRLEQYELDTGMYGLHWIDCLEIRVEPKDLKGEFLQFYAASMRHRVKPKLAVIERKSTGVTLVSVLNEMQGLQIIDLPRLKSKTERFLEAQPYVAAKQISLPEYGKHTQNVVEHCRKITVNQSHRFDDIADTLADAIKVALIDRIILNNIPDRQKDEQVAQSVMSKFQQLQRIRSRQNGNYYS